MTLVLAMSVSFALGATQRAEDYSIIPPTDEPENFFGRTLVSDGNTSLVVAGEYVPGSTFNGRVYFLELRQGRWEIAYVTGDLPGGPFTESVINGTIEGDVAVLTGWAHSGAPGGSLNYLYTFLRTPGAGWEFESVQRVPQVYGQPLALWVELRAGLLTFGNWDRVITYKLEPSGWRRMPGLFLSPFLAGATGPGRVRELTRGDRDLFMRRFYSGSSGANFNGWHHYEWRQGRWIRNQIIGFQQLGTSNPYYPNGGADADGEWFVYGAEGVLGGVGAVIAHKRNPLTGDYEYHSTIRPAVSFPGSSYAEDKFGSSLDLDVLSGRLLVGAPMSGAPAGGNAGRAILFTYDATLDEWVESEEYTYSERAGQGPNEYFDFGYQVALWDNGALVSLRNIASASGNVGVGKLYVFEDSFGVSYCQGTSTAAGQEATLVVSGSNVLPYAGLRVEAHSLPPSTPVSALISSSSSSVLLPQGSGEAICVGGPRVSTGGIRQTGADGSIRMGFNVSDPSLMGVLAGDRRFVQLWFRMPAGSVQPIGLTNAVEILFR